jgi:hypothetical protein
MSTISRRLLLGASLAGGLMLGFAPAATAATSSAIPVSPVFPGQVFTGLVNGEAVGSGISSVNGYVPLQVDCGPPVAGEPAPGSAAPGQALEVALGGLAGAPFPGFTGSAGTSITAELLFQLTPTGPTYVEKLATFTDYGVIEPFPSVSTPCSGTGAVEFVPSPTSPTARTAEVPVAFETHGAQPGSASR